MNIAVIGGGITGLTAAYELIKRGHTVSVFEKDQILGGLAGGFKPEHSDWNWKLEKTYHHFFTNDQAIISLAKELGLKKDLMILSPTTSIFWNHTQYPFDTPINILKFPGLSVIDRVRTGMIAAIMKLNPWWQPLEHITAKRVFQILNGKSAWNIIWEPLLNAKFGSFADEVAASWLWARFHKRTTHLGYFNHGFSQIVEALKEKIQKNGGVILTNTAISRVTKQNKSYVINNKKFDKVLITTPSIIATKLIEFPKKYEQQLLEIPHLWAQTLILETDAPLLDNTYWLNVNDASFPFVAVVQHTNMIDTKEYGGHHIAYIGNYLPDNHPFLTMTKEQLLKKFLPYLKKINPNINYKPCLAGRQVSTLNSYLFTVPNAQPVHTREYSKKAPTLRTPIPNIYLANLDSIYPWDRGTNYAVELGQKAANIIVKTP